MKTMRRVLAVVLACVVLSLATWIALVLRFGWIRGTLVGLVVAAAVVGSYAVGIGPWQRRWGATDEEVLATMPGDDRLRPDAPGTTRAITIAAPPGDVFPWLLQIGYGRGGWYSYDWLDNDGRPSLDRIDPSLQGLCVGDRIEMIPGMGPTVREIVPEDHLLSAGESDTWCLQVRPDGAGGTRLVSRWRQDWPRTLGTAVWTTLSDPGAFVMERKMLLTLKRHAEAAAPEAAGGRTRI
jgi:hypothetical protein